MAQSDTDLVRAFMEKVDHLPQAKAGELVGVDQRTVSRWRGAIDRDEDITISAAARNAIDRYLIAAKGREFREGVELAIREIRAVLQDLEGRLEGAPISNDGGRAADRLRARKREGRRTGTEDG